jgi:hypothetical protein
VTRLVAAAVLLAAAWVVGGLVGMLVFEGRQRRHRLSPFEVEVGIRRLESLANHPSGRAL